MLTEFRKKSQITIPKDIVKKLGIKEGDQLNVYEQKGLIHIVPVAVYPKKYVESLENEIKNIKNQIKDGNQPVFDSVEDMFKELDSTHKK